jgi:YEATS domain-containing protein 4
MASPEHSHRWTVAVRGATSAPDSDIVGGADDLSYFIKRVTFKLHDTYPNPTRSEQTLLHVQLLLQSTMTTRRRGQTSFRGFRNGVCALIGHDIISGLDCYYSWGEFEIQIRINFIPESGEKPITLYHHLKLHPWTATGDPEIPHIDTAMQMGPVHSWQYDEIVFIDPTQSFLGILMAHPPTPLPKARKRPVPFNLANPGSLEASRGGVPEFNSAMEKEESERLVNGRNAIVAEQERWRGILAEKEKELEQLKKELEATDG